MGFGLIHARLFFFLRNRSCQKRSCENEENRIKKKKTFFTTTLHWLEFYRCKSVQKFSKANRKLYATQINAAVVHTSSSSLPAMHCPKNS